MANNVIETLEVDVVLNADKYNKSAKDLDGKNDDLAKGLDSLVKGFGKWMGALATATGIEKLVNDVARANDQLGFLEKQLNLNTNTIRNWQGALTAGGGSAEGATNSFKTLTNSINGFVLKGEAGLTPYLNSLGVSMFDTQGHIRKTDQIMLDLADTFSKMDSSQAYSIGKDMGFDEGTIGSLIQGRDALKESLAYQNALYKSSEQDIKNSRELQKNRALLNSQWDSFKTMMGNQLIPIFNSFAKVLLNIFETMQKHQDTVKRVFGGLAIIMSASIIPLFIKALAPLLAFIKPFSPFVGVVAALSAGFLLLYDDYKTWAEGSKSLFDWGALKKFMDENEFSAKNLGEAFKDMGKNLLENTVPTLKAYMEIVQKLARGDIAGAVKQANTLLGNFSDIATGTIAKATGQKAGDIGGFIGESAYRLTHRGKTYEEYNAKPVTGNANNKQAFITKYMPVAQQVGSRLGVPPEALLGQWAQETGWGKSITKGSGYNLGNIKAGSSWNGKTVKAFDKREGSNDAYRVYDTPEQFADDYVKLISNRKGYQGAIGQSTPEGFFRGLQKGGYATDANYVQNSLRTTNSVQAEIARMNSANMMRGIQPKLPMGTSTTNNAGNTTNTVTVNMNGMNINTTASTLSGVTADAISNNQNFLNLIGTMK